MSARDSVIEKLHGIWPVGSSPTSADELALLSLEDMRRRQALDRLEAIASYRAKAATATALAAKLNISRKHFHTLLKRWDDDPTIISLAPAAVQTFERIIADDSRTQRRAMAAKMIAAIIAEGNTPLSPKIVERRLRENVDAAALPSSTAIHHLYTKTIPVIEDGWRLLPDWVFENVGRTPGQPRTIFVVDHVVIDRPVLDSTRDTRWPVLGILLDGYSRIIMGYALSTGAPGPRETIAIWADAGDRNCSSLSDRATAPSIVIRVGKGNDWAALKSAVVSTGALPIVRRSVPGSTGALASRLLGPSLAGVRLRARTDPVRVPAPSRAAWEMVDLADLVGHAVAAHNHDRQSRYPERRSAILPSVASTFDAIVANAHDIGLESSDDR